MKYVSFFLLLCLTACGERVDISQAGNSLANKETISDSSVSKSPETSPAALIDDRICGMTYVQQTGGIVFSGGDELRLEHSPNDFVLFSDNQDLNNEIQKLKQAGGGVRVCVTSRHEPMQGYEGLYLNIDSIQVMSSDL